jgi:protease I
VSQRQHKVLIVVGDATETVDTLYPYLRVQEEGILPVVAAPQKRRYQMVLHEIPQTGWDITREYEGYTIAADIAFRDVDVEDYLGIFFSGGRAPEYVRYDEDLMRITRWFFERDKAGRLRLPRRGDPGQGRRRAGPADGNGGQVPL